MNSRHRKIFLIVGNLLLFVAFLVIFAVFRNERKPAGNTTAVDQTLPAVAPLVARPSSAAPTSTEPPPQPGDPLPEHIEKLWPKGSFLSQTDKVTPLGTERVSIIQPSDLPYPIRIQEFFPNNGESVLVSEIIADRVLVGKPADIPHENFATILSGLGDVEIRRLTRSGVYQVIFRNGTPGPDTVPDAVRRLQAQFPVRYAEPDYVVRVASSPDDARYLDGSLWGLHNTGQNSGTADADIDAPEGWAIRTSAPNVIVGVIDTGIALNHEDLAPNLWVNPNETDDDTDSDNNGFIDDLHGINAIQLNGDPSDDQGHGSHVAGTIGAAGNNGVGITGVAWNVKLMGLKFLSASGGGATSDAITCIDYGVEHGAHILSNSWGGGGFSQALLDSIQAARDAGVIFVVAAGNAATDNDVAPVFPASLPVDNIVAVASTTRTDELSSFSCFGQGSVDIAAPGSEILSADYENPTGYKSFNGTSMATPHVSGVLALLRAEFPTDTWGQLINRLYRGGDALPALADGKIANGRRLNLHGALTTTNNRPLNDDFASARPLYGDAILLRTFNHGATAEPGQPAIHGAAAANTIWFSFTSLVNGNTSIRVPAGETLNVATNGQMLTIPYAVIPTVVEVFSGSDLGSLTSVGSGTDFVSFTAQAGVTYRFAVAGQADAEGLIMLEVVGPPRNATLATALPLILGASQSGTNRNALPEPGEPAHAGQTAAASIWYKWTASLTGRVAFSTAGSNFDTLAAVYSGPAASPTFASLVPVAANDNAVGPDVTFSRIEFNAVAGVTYYFAFDGKAGATGTTAAVLAVPPANDNFASPAILSGTDVTRGLNTFHASREPGEPVPYPGNGAGESLWFTWTAPESGRTTIDLAGSFFPGIIAVYTGNAVDALTLVNQDGAGNRFAQVTFDATQGTTYRILVDAWDWSLSNVPLRLRMVPVPANDSFADSVELQGQRATIVGSNVGSTFEPDEPTNNSRSVWYRWTAPATGTYGLYGERLNKPDQWIIVLNVFTGSAVNALTLVKEDRMNGIGRDAFARFAATAGTTYHFQVTGLIDTGIMGGAGPFRLDLRPIAEHAPANDHFANAIPLDGSTVFNFRTQNYGASAEPGEGPHSTYTPFRSLWWKFAVPAGQSGRYALATTLGEGDVGTTIYRADDPANPTLGALTQVASNVEFANQNFPDLAWQADEGQVYYIAVENYGGALGRVVFNFQKVPANTTFATAKTIPASGLSEITYNYGSTHETGEPASGFSPATVGRRSLWWAWTAPASGRYQVDTIGSRLGVYEDSPISAQFGSPTILGLWTVLGVYTGNSVGSLTPVATNARIASYSNSPWSFQRNSRVEFDAAAGTTYRVMVNANAFGTTAEQWERNTHLGEIHFNFRPVTPPANDAFANATPITGTTYQTLVTNLGASKESGEPNHGGLTNGRTLWWRWTAPASGIWIVSTAGNLYDDYNARRTGLGIYTGSSVNALSTVASNQNGAGIGTGEFTWSAASFTAVEGTTYHFGVDSVHAGNLSFLLTRPAPNDAFAQATLVQGSRWTATGHNLLTTVEPGEPKIESFFNPPPVSDSTVRSVWWRWTAPVSGPITLDTLGSQMFNALGVYTGSALGALAPVVTTPNTGDYINGEGPNRARSGTQRVTFDAVAGTTYQITVQGAGFSNSSAGPITLALVGPPAVPFAPADFTAVRTGPATIELDWTDVAVDEEYYQIERSPDGAAWTLLQQTAPDTAFHTDITAVEGADYYYRIRAVNTVGQSAWVAAAVTIPQPPPAPAALLVTALSAHDLSITWTPAANAASHRIERSADAGSTWTLAATLGATASSHTDVGLAPATTYHYRVRAANAIGSGPWSATASGATATPGTLSIAYPESTYAETAGGFTATVTRTGTSGAQTVFLTSGSARLTVPQSVVIADGLSSATFPVTINGDALVNPTDIATITAFAPAALIGESFTGPVDAAVNSQNTGWGWNGAWYSNNSPAVLVEPSLTYTKNGTISSPGTRAVRLNSSGGTDARRFFATKYNTGEIWVSTLLHRNSTNWGTQMIIRENTSGGINASIAYESNTAHWQLKTSTGSAALIHGANPSSQVHYLVMRFDFTGRQIHAWFSPDVSGTTPANALGSATLAMPEALTGISRLDLFGYSTADGFDEIRIANSFANLHGGFTAARNLRLIDDEAYTPAQAWLAENFNSPIPTGSGAWNADPDADGMVNLLEYALASDPTDPTDTSHPQITHNGSHLVLSFLRAREELIYQIQTSTGLDDWSDFATNPGEAGTMVESLIPATGSRRFVRVAVSWP